MKKKLVRLTEGDLHRIIKESVNRVIKEFNSMPKTYDSEKANREIYDMNKMPSNYDRTFNRNLKNNMLGGERDSIEKYRNRMYDKFDVNNDASSLEFKRAELEDELEPYNYEAQYDTDPHNYEDYNWNTFDFNDGQALNDKYWN